MAFKGDVKALVIRYFHCFIIVLVVRNNLIVEIKQLWSPQYFGIIMLTPIV